MRRRFDDDERWTAAFSVVRGRPVDLARAIRNADQWRVGGISALIGVAVLAAFWTTGSFDAFYGSDRTGSEGWRNALSIVGLVMAAAGLIAAFSRRFGLERVAGLPAESPTQWLTRPQRQIVDRQLTGADVFDPFLLPLSYDRAARMINEPLPLVQSTSGAFLLSLITRGGPVSIVVGLWTLTVVGVALALPQQWALRTAAQRFVAEHGQV